MKAAVLQRQLEDVGADLLGQHEGRVLADARPVQQYEVPDEGGKERNLAARAAPASATRAHSAPRCTRLSLNGFLVAVRTLQQHVRLACSSCVVHDETVLYKTLLHGAGRRQADRAADTLALELLGIVRRDV